LVAFDDFLDRKQYHVVLHYYDKIESTADKSMVILKKKPAIPIVSNTAIMAYQGVLD
jgi:hypothetical protein